MKYPSILLCLICAFAGQAAAQEAPETRRIENARIIYRAQNPHAGSGNLHVRVRVQADVDGTVIDFYQTYFGPDDVIPDVGDVCTFSFHRDTVDFDLREEERLALDIYGNQVDSFECRDAGSMPRGT